MAKVHRLRIVLGLTADDFPGLVVGGTDIYNKMSQNAATFSAPNPPMPVLKQQLDEYCAAHQEVVSTKARGASALREVKRNALWSSLESERACVQVVCDASPGNAADYAAKAGMRIWVPGTKTQEVLTAEITTVPGQVHLRAAASLLVGPGGGKYRKRTYFWRYAVSGTSSYVMVEATPVCHTLVSGLAAASTFAFQVAVKDPEGMSEWSQPVMLQLH